MKNFNLMNMVSQNNQVKYIPIEMLVPYHNHQFKLYSGERFDDMAESIRKNGILSPILVQAIESGSKYEILSGHNRVECAKAVGLSTVPAIVKENLSEEEAEIYVIETNLMQRGFNELSISEQATVLQYHNAKMFSQGKRNDILEELTRLEHNSTSSQIETKLSESSNSQTSSQFETKLSDNPNSQTSSQFETKLPDNSNSQTSSQFETKLSENPTPQTSSQFETKLSESSNSQTSSQFETKLPDNPTPKTSSQFETKLSDNSNSQTSSQFETKLTRNTSLDKVGDSYGMSRPTVARLIRVNYLIQPFKDLVDSKAMPLMVGVELSYIPKEDQETVYTLTTAHRKKLNIKLAKEIRKLFTNGDATTMALENLLIGQKPPTEMKKISISKDIYLKYFDKKATSEEITETIHRALDSYFNKA